MFAVVDINGQQFKVKENEKYYVPRLDKKPNSKISFSNVILFGDDKETKIGNPTISGLKVSDKVIVFKKKRRKGYEKKNGHRQQLTRIEITKIG